MSDFSIKEAQTSFEQELSYQEWLRDNMTPLSNDDIEQLEKSYKKGINR